MAVAGRMSMVARGLTARFAACTVPTAAVAEGSPFGLARAAMRLFGSTTAASTKILPVAAAVSAPSTHQFRAMSAARPRSRLDLRHHEKDTDLALTKSVHIIEALVFFKLQLANGHPFFPTKRLCSCESSFQWSGRRMRKGPLSRGARRIMRGAPQKCEPARSGDLGKGETKWMEVTLFQILVCWVLVLGTHFETFLCTRLAPQLDSPSKLGAPQHFIQPPIAGHTAGGF
jgi:hypothetical protein